MYFAIILATGAIAALPFVWQQFHLGCRLPASSNCINNPRQIDDAKQQWALEKQKETNDVPSTADIAQYVHGEVPKCAVGGIYTLGPVSESPRCSMTGHVLT